MDAIADEPGPWRIVHADRGTIRMATPVPAEERQAILRRQALEARERRRRLMARAWLLAGELRLSDSERRELAMMLPTRSGASGPVSWAMLDERELSRIVKWLQGANLVLELYGLRA